MAKTTQPHQIDKLAKDDLKKWAWLLLREYKKKKEKEALAISKKV